MNANAQSLPGIISGKCKKRQQRKALQIIKDTIVFIFSALSVVFVFGSVLQSLYDTFEGPTAPSGLSHTHLGIVDLQFDCGTSENLFELEGSFGSLDPAPGFHAYDNFFELKENFFIQDSNLELVYSTSDNYFELGINSFELKSTISMPFHCGFCEAQFQVDKNEKNVMKRTGYGCMKTKECIYCSAELFSDEGHGWCCNKGKTNAVLRNQRPEFFTRIDDSIVHLYTTNNTEFEMNTRKYNKLFCFSSMAANGIGSFDTYMGSRNNGGNVCVNGRTYHRVFHCQDTTHRQENNPMKWYLIDPLDRARSAQARQLDMGIYRNINDYIITHNRIAKEITRIPFSNYEEYSCGLQYNSNCTEIGSFILDDVRHVQPRSIIYSRLNDTRPVQMSTLNGFYEPMQYPLLMTTGAIGWDSALRTDFKLSQMQYYRYQNAYRLQVIPNRDPPRINAIDADPRPSHAELQDHNCHWTSTNRLYNEYLVDMYSRMVDERVSFWKKDEVQGRIASYREYDNAIQSSMDTTDIGRQYLPAGVNGSKRKSKMQVNNAMHLVDVYGKADYFVTLTTNPNWPEIQRHLLQNQTAFDRPDIVNRVFKIKLGQVMKKLRRGDYFGGFPREYEVKVIEFQIRGLPHAHIAIKYSYPENHNLFQYVKAVIPPVSENSTDEEKRIHQIICQHNLHKNDGHLCSLNRGKTYTCREETHVVCKRNFPKKLSAINTFDDRGYPIYIRTDPEDLFVVAYNERLSLDWDGHANVEICSSTTCIAYLYKYVFKGPVMTTVHTQQNGVNISNEIDDFITGRYVSASEAHWHISGFALYSAFPIVRPLSTHMPGDESVMINEDTGVVTKVISQLDHYYGRPNLPIFHDLKLTEFYEHFHVHKTPPSSPSAAVWENAHGFFIVPRLRGKEHARFFTLLPFVGEKYYLQMILRCTPAYSTDELYIHSGIRYGTLRAAALSRDLFSAESEYADVFSEVADLQTPAQLRFLLVNVFVEGGPGLDILDVHWEKLIEGDPTRHNKIMLLYDLSDRFESQGRAAADFGLPSEDDLQEMLSFDRRMNFDRQTELRRYDEISLDSEKVAIIKSCEEVLKNHTPDTPTTVIFIQAPAGYGKTNLAKGIQHYLQGNGFPVMVTATTNSAANLYENGQTPHMAFGLPVSDDTSITSSVTRSSWKAARILESVILWDEAASSHAKNIEAFEALLRDLKRNEVPWGGVPLIIFFGDFMQIAPIVQEYGDMAAISASIRLSPLWNNQVQVIQLTKNYRQQLDPSYAQEITAIGHGLNRNISGADFITPPTSNASHIVVIPTAVTYSPDDLISHAFPSIEASGIQNLSC